MCVCMVETGGQGKCLIIGMYVSLIASSLGSGSPPTHENQGTGLRVCVLYTERLITSLRSMSTQRIRLGHRLAKGKHLFPQPLLTHSGCRMVLYCW